MDGKVPPGPESPGNNARDRDLRLLNERIGLHCARMQAVYDLVADILAIDVPLLLSGEPGTGKDFLAQVIHELGPRAGHPFRVFSPSAEDETMAGSAIFGHEVGAFTGATELHVGWLEEAGNGTVVIDEFSEILQSVQLKFLGPLQKRVFRRLGGKKDISLRARLIFTTNRALTEQVAQGRFRLDLLSRASIYEIPLPPLRVCREDIPFLARRLMFEAARECHKQVVETDSEALRLLVAYDYQLGNIRELRNIMLRAVIRSRSAIIVPDVLPDNVRVFKPGSDNPDEDAAREREWVLGLLRQANGFVARAAKLSGVSEPTFRELMRKHGIEPPRRRHGQGSTEPTEQP
jgi:two-component system NtrC family response regulator